MAIVLACKTLVLLCSIDTVWTRYPEEDGATPDAEIDALAVVDGALYLIEAKSSASLDSKELDQLVSVSSRIRPNVLLLACMDEDKRKLSPAVEALSRKLDEGIKVESMHLKPDEFHSAGVLP